MHDRLEDKVRNNPDLSPASKEIGVIFARAVDDVSDAYVEKLNYTYRQYDLLIKSLRSLRTVLDDFEQRLSKLENGF